MGKGQARPSNREKSDSVVVSQRRFSRGPVVVLLLCVLISGLAARAWLTDLAVRWAYVPDHFDNIGMGLTAEEHGLFKVYSVSPENNPEVSGQVYDKNSGTFIPRKRRPPRVANYPPLGVGVFYLQTKLLGVLGGQIKANTFGARAVMSLAAILAELVLAVGVFMLAGEMFNRTVGLVAACVCWLFPPLVMDSSFWGQTDAIFLAPAVFAVYLMMKRKWLAAGGLVAIATLLKPQGILLGPIVLFACFVVGGGGGKVTARLVAVRLAKALGAAAVVGMIIALPWTISDGWTWLDQSYIANLKAYEYTTLKAFNIWYFDALRLDAKPAFSALDSTATIGGLSKDAWGRGLLVASLAGLAGLCWWRYRRDKMGLVIFSGLWLWSCFVWPTRVHERYIVYSMPLLIVAAAGVRRYWPAVAGLAIVGVASMCWNVWLKSSAGSFYPQVAQAYYQQLIQLYERHSAGLHPGMRPAPPTPQDAVRRYWIDYNRQREKYRSWEYLLAIISLASYGWAFTVACIRQRPP